MEYILIRQKRKTISLNLNEKGQLIVKAPLKASVAKIESFIKEKQNWIAKQMKRLETLSTFQAQFDFQHFVYIFGERYDFDQFNFAGFSSAKDKAKRLANFYIKTAQEKLPEMVEECKDGMRCDSVKLTNSKRIWGSFDRNYNMKLNWRLIILPKPLIKYVVIHELCHGLQLNHSKAFWQEVSTRCPDYKQLKKQLEMYSFLLK